MSGVRSVLSVVVAAVLLPAAPAVAGTTWSTPQVVDRQPGTGIVLSADGRLAMWIVGAAAEVGPVRSARYDKATKRWRACSPPPGIVGASRVQVTLDGALALIDVPGTGYLMSARTADVWGQPQPVATGAYLMYGQMTADGASVIWVDWSQTQSDPTVPGKVMAAQRGGDGTWSSPVVVGTIDQEYEDYGELPIVMSPDGSALAWVNENRALQIYGRSADGTWAAPTTIWRYKYLPYVGSMRFSSSGTRLIWTVEDTDGVFTAVRSAGRWSGADYVSTDEAFGPTISPDGRLVAFASYSDDSVFAKRFQGGRWTRVKRVGKGSEESLITAGRNTLAWNLTNRTSPRGPLWATTWHAGKWLKATKLSRAAVDPVLNPAGTTLLYTDLKRDAVLATRH